MFKITAKEKQMIMARRKKIQGTDNEQVMNYLSRYMVRWGKLSDEFQDFIDDIESEINEDASPHSSQLLNAVQLLKELDYQFGVVLKDVLDEDLRRYKKFKRLMIK